MLVSLVWCGTHKKMIISGIMYEVHYREMWQKLDKMYLKLHWFIIISSLVLLFYFEFIRIVYIPWGTFKYLFTKVQIFLLVSEVKNQFIVLEKAFNQVFYF